VFDINAWSIPSHDYLVTDETVKGLEEAIQRGKNALKELAESFDLEVETIFTEGDPGHEIVRVAEELNADLIVLGTHGYTGWKRFTIGSVAELVVRHAPCAVLTIRPKGK
jgi:nucleotide-binding universal stress UspA family protein